MKTRRKILSAMVAAFGGGACTGVATAAPTRPAGLVPVQAPPPDAQLLFAVEFRTGPRWDHAKPAHEQAHFREHSANLKKLRDGGHLLLGARYSDKGFLVMTGTSAAAVKELLDADPAVQNQTFAFDLHDFRVFHAGCVGTAAGTPRRQSEGRGADDVAMYGAGR